jgi:hypothetical protein
LVKASTAVTQLVDKPVSLNRMEVEGQERPATRERPGERFSVRLRIAGAVVLVFVFVLSFVFPPSGLSISFCVFRKAFGVPCPGCGLTRSFAALSHGQTGAAFHMHPLGPFIYAGLAFYMVKWAAEALLHRRLLAAAEDKLRLPVLWGLLVVITAVWIYRLVAGTTT